MTQRELIRRIEPMLVECCLALMESYGVSVRCEGEAERAEVADAGVVAFVGFLGRTVLGNLVISAPSSFIDQSMPVAPESETQETMRRDWACELANQLLGRLKLRLEMYNVSFEMSTPNATMARELRGFCVLEGPLVLRFSTSDTPFFVELEILPSPQFTMLDQPLPDAVSVLEGEILMLV